MILSMYSFLGALQMGFVYGLVALGVYLSFRILDFPDLTVDGSFTLGASVSAVLIVHGVDPYLSLLGSIFAGALAGLVTATLNLRFKILHLLASILTMTALYTINLHIMGKPNIALIQEPTVVTLWQGLFGLGKSQLKWMVAGGTTLVIGGMLVYFLSTQYGVALRAVGANPRMARANGVSVHAKVYTGMALSNALVGLAGGLFAQLNGFADTTMGIGTIVIGLAAVIIGETLFNPRSVLVAIMACVFGAILYRLIIAVALDTSFLGLQSADLQLVTAIIVAMALILPQLRKEITTRRIARRFKKEFTK